MKMSFSVSVNPTFFLKKIDPFQVYENYKTGKYNDIKFPENKVSVRLETPINTIVNTYEKDSNSPVFIYKDRGNYNQVVATSNAQNLESNKGGDCDWCRRFFTEDTIGIPVRLDFEKDKPTIVYTEGYFCCFECAYSDIKWRKGLSIRYRDSLYMDSEQMLKYVYFKMHPDATCLMEAPDYRLVKRNGGSIEYAEFFTKTHKYNRTPHVIFSPIKVQYLKNVLI